MAENDKISKSDMEWQEQLDPDAFYVCRKQGTERAFSGKFHNDFSPGEYFCVCCGNHLFSSSDKFDSGCGWPSFTKPVRADALENRMDYSHAMVRVEVVCSRCDAHMGHVFDDGPAPFGLRYCINSVALRKEKI